VALLALIAGTVSYLHMHMLIARHGLSGWVAAPTPLSVEGMIVPGGTTLPARFQVWTSADGHQVPGAFRPVPFRQPDVIDPNRESFPERYLVAHRCSPARYRCRSRTSAAPRSASSNCSSTWDNATLLAIPRISGVRPGIALYQVLSEYFVGVYFAQLKRSGEPVLGCSVTQPSVRVTLDSASQPVYSISVAGGQTPVIDTSCLDSIVVDDNPRHPPHFRILRFTYADRASDRKGESMRATTPRTSSVAAAKRSYEYGSSPPGLISVKIVNHDASSRIGMRRRNVRYSATVTVAETHDLLRAGMPITQADYDRHQGVPLASQPETPTAPCPSKRPSAEC
jgi:hypothetical protein